MYFENEVGPGPLQSSLQQTCTHQESQTMKTESKHSQWPTLYVLGLLAARMFVKR